MAKGSSTGGASSPTAKYLLQAVPSGTFACISPATPQAGIKGGAGCSRRLVGHSHGKPCLSGPQAKQQCISLNSLICQAPGKVAVHGSVGQLTADHTQDLALHGACMAAPSPVDLTPWAPQLQSRFSPVTDLSAPVDSSRLNSGRQKKWLALHSLAHVLFGRIGHRSGNSAAQTVFLLQRDGTQVQTPARLPGLAVAPQSAVFVVLLVCSMLTC